MSAILVVTSKHAEDVAEHHFCSALAALRWRGRMRQVERLPHGWLAVVRLGTKGSSGGADIFRDELGNVAACHGRLYDLPDLYRALGEPLPPDAEDHPARAVLAAYLKWGSEAAAKWVGELSFVIWDQREGRLVAGRDHVGTRPLFYYDHAGLTAFCTDSKALLTLGGRIPEPDPVAMHRFLCLYTYQDERTFFMRVRRVTPGQVMVLEGGKVKAQTYWDARRVDPVSYADAGDYLEHFKELLSRAVARRLHGVPNYSVENGRDGFSTLLSSLLGRPDLNQAANAEGTDPGGMRRLAAGGVPPALLTGNLDLLDELSRMNIFHDEPVAAVPVITSWLMRNEASDLGSGIQLNQIGANEILCQQVLSLSHLLKTGHWTELLRRMRDARSPGERSLRASLLVFLHLGLGPLLPVSLLDTRRSFRHKDRFPWLNSTLTRLPLERDSGPKDGFSSEVHRQISSTLTHGILPIKLHYEDRHTGILGVEPRFPFLDLDVVRFALGMPPEKLFGPDSLASALQEAAPRMVGRPDASSPAVRLQSALDGLWLQQGFQKKVVQTLDESQLVADGWLRGDKLRELQGRVLGGRQDLRDHLWRVLTLEGWYRQRWSSQVTAVRKPALRIAPGKLEQFG